MSDEANTKPQFAFPEMIVKPAPLTLNQIWGDIIKPFTAIAPTNSAFIDATINCEDIGNGYTLDYNSNGILWRVNAGGIPHPDDLEKFYEQQEIIQGYSESKSNINLDKINELLDGIGDLLDVRKYMLPLAAQTLMNSDVAMTGLKNIASQGLSKARTGEQVLEKVKSYEQARNKALDLVGNLGPDSKPYVGRLGTGEGSIVGRQSADGKVRWRLDYDPEKGPHINVEDFRNGKGDNAIKVAIPFAGDIKTVEELLKYFNR
ncbi:hypothetical protein SPSIL_002660 [Sporomusa silvacetica DSM 10669]|uniref:Uncharacterized protein n=1 Tax=Sporomusa silvacetica DSM 10669 TaxID=1123289 RepID=A0ABZ3IEP8_9FIRM|nr:hypothetical protein SPSIL_29720 [Sporomusa silvacetica DSM 10669]